MANEDRARFIAVNGGSSSVKLSVYTTCESPRRLMKAHIDRIGSPESMLTVADAGGAVQWSRPVQAADHRGAADRLVEWLDESELHSSVAGIGHRIVHGGIHVTDHQLITPQLIAELQKARSLDLAHLALQISLVEAFQSRFPDVPQVACLDTAFHRDLPRVAQLLPIPRGYLDAGVRRLGFHGLSYTYLLQALERIAGTEAAKGRVILAHLGSGASMAAVRDGRPLDTTMGFTPAAGLMMGTRPGDLDPGLLVYLIRTARLSPDDADDLISRQCGLLGVSGRSSDVRELAKMRTESPAAADALNLFCYSARKWVGAYAAVLGGIDTLVFSGGIGEHSPEIRSEICAGLEFLGMQIDAERNGASAPLISAAASKVAVRVIPTDEEAVIAAIVCDLVANHQIQTQGS